MLRKVSSVPATAGTPRPLIAAHLVAAVVVGANLLVAPRANAQSYNYITLNGIADANETQAYGITDGGIVVGNYRDAGDGQQHSFFYNIATGTYTTNIPEPPNPSITDAFADVTGMSNSRLIVGTYGDDLDGHQYGYLNNAGTFTAPISDPNEDSLNTHVSGVNNSGTVIGLYTNNASRIVSFTYSGGTFKDLAGPTGAYDTDASGINDSGVIVGGFSDFNGIAGNYGFIDNGGTYTTLNVAGSFGGGTTGTGPLTSASGLNNLGEVVGFYEDTSGDVDGFLYSSSTGAYTYLDEPDEVDGSMYGSSGTQLSGINDSGDIVGTYSTNNTDYGFLAIPIAGAAAASEPGSDALMFLGSVSALGVAMVRRARARRSL